MNTKRQNDKTTRDRVAFTMGAYNVARLDEQKIGSTAGIHPKVLRAQKAFGKKPGAKRYRAATGSRDEHDLQHRMMHGNDAGEMAHLNNLNRGTSNVTADKFYKGQI